MSLREDWLPVEVYGRTEYTARIEELLRRRYYGRDAADKAGILRYTKVDNALLDLDDIPPPRDERELAWLMSFYWHVDEAHGSLPDLARHLQEGRRPGAETLRELGRKYESALGLGLELQRPGHDTLGTLGID